MKPINVLSTFLLYLDLSYWTHTNTEPWIYLMITWFNHDHHLSKKKYIVCTATCIWQDYPSEIKSKKLIVRS